MLRDSVATESIYGFAREAQQADVSPAQDPIFTQSPGFRTALELARTDPESPRDILQAIAPETEHKLEAANEELARLEEKNRLLKESVAALAEENKLLKQGAATIHPKKFFDMLESLSMNLIGPALDDQAIDSDEREIARELRVRPDELRHYLLKGRKTILRLLRS